MIQLGDIIKIEKTIEILLKNETGKSRNIKQIQEEFLEKAIEILSKTEALFEGRDNTKTNENKLKVLKRYARLTEGKDDIQDIDELMNKCIEYIKDKLSKESLKLDFDIYPVETKMTIPEGSGEFETKREKVDKYKILINIFNKKGINLDEIVVYEEKLNKKRMRQFPYKIIYVREKEIERTILISDEIGQATYVYEGIINTNVFKDRSKKESVEGLSAKKIIYGLNYEENLEKTIFGIYETKTINKNIQVDLGVTTKETPLKTILEWKNKLEGYKEKLEQESNILERDGIWYFGDAKGNNTWTYLKCFPNVTFNRENNVGDDRGQINNSKELKIMFETLGLKVETEEQEQKRWKEILVGYKDKLEQESNILERDGIWYFGNAKGNNTWTYLKCFPNMIFNRENNIGGNKGQIQNIKELKKMFETLGLKVITEEQEQKRWKEILVGYKDKLEQESNILERDGIWYFGNAKGAKTWTYLKSFPNMVFNRENNIGGDIGQIQNIKELKKMFETLGLKVASKEQEKKRWKEILVGYKEKLEQESNILEKDGIWYFGNAKGKNAWKYLKSFPNQVFNRENNIGDDRGQIQNIKELKKMFETLGLKSIK